MIDVEDYVKRQIAVFQANELLEDRERRPGRGRDGNLSYGPYLLISREKGAGGNTVARLVGRRLGWQVFNNEIVDEIAQKAHVRRQLIESLDERDQATIQDTIGQLLNPQEIGTSGYLGYLKQIVLTLGHQGDVVIVGRGAQFILPGQFGLCVRMVAPIEVRIRRIADKARLSLEAARVEVERIDRERVKLVRRHFGHDVTDPLSHDLIINTAAMNVEAVAEVVITALQRKLGVQIKASGQR
ncbi:MAG: cytidylate kinase-like family protein [Verrucomicrobiota bacterium]|jgi:cytidylate kinase